MRMAAVSTERPVVGPHCHAKASGDRLLTERQVVRTLDQVLQKQIVGAFFAVAQLELQAVELEPRFTADVDLHTCRFLTSCCHIQINPPTETLIAVDAEDAMFRRGNDLLGVLCTLRDERLPNTCSRSAI